MNCFSTSDFSERTCLRIIEEWGKSLVFLRLQQSKTEQYTLCGGTCRTLVTENEQ